MLLSSIIVKKVFFHNRYSFLPCLYKWPIWYVKCKRYKKERNETAFFKYVRVRNSVDPFKENQEKYRLYLI